MHDCNIGTDGIYHLEGCFPCLQQLILSWNWIGSEGARVLCKFKVYFETSLYYCHHKMYAKFLLTYIDV